MMIGMWTYFHNAKAQIGTDTINQAVVGELSPDVSVHYCHARMKITVFSFSLPNYPDLTKSNLINSNIINPN